jgi:hypothetical protein
LADDGLGYDMYIINDSIGQYQSFNDLEKIEVYKIPYDYLTTLKLIKNDFIASGSSSNKYQDLVVSHPNPAEYWVNISDKPQVTSDKLTLVLNQGFNEGWLAFRTDTENCKIKTLCQMFPYIFGKRLTDHVLVNNWGNGWQLPVDSSKLEVRSENNILRTMNYEPITIYILFWPQVLEFLGLALLPIPFLLILKKH